MCTLHGFSSSSPVISEVPAYRDVYLNEAYSNSSCKTSLVTVSKVSNTTGNGRHSLFSYAFKCETITHDITSVKVINIFQFCCRCTMWLVNTALFMWSKCRGINCFMRYIFPVIEQSDCYSCNLNSDLIHYIWWSQNQKTHFLYSKNEYSFFLANLEVGLLCKLCHICETCASLPTQ